MTQKIFGQIKKSCIFALANGTVAQLVQSACLTGMRSQVRFLFAPQKNVITAFFFYTLPGRQPSWFRALPSHGRGHWFESSTSHSEPMNIGFFYSLSHFSILIQFRFTFFSKKTYFIDLSTISFDQGTQHYKAHIIVFQILTTPLFF